MTAAAWDIKPTSGSTTTTPSTCCRVVSKYRVVLRVVVWGWFVMQPWRGFPALQKQSSYESFRKLKWCKVQKQLPFLLQVRIPFGFLSVNENRYKCRPFKKAKWRKVNFRKVRPRCHWQMHRQCPSKAKHVYTLSLSLSHTHNYKTYKEIGNLRKSVGTTVQEKLLFLCAVNVFNTSFWLPTVWISPHIKQVSDINWLSYYSTQL